VIVMFDMSFLELLVAVALVVFDVVLVYLSLKG
jgi:hypothetical protein